MEHILAIKKVIAGGRGLSLCDDGMVAMTPGVLPGETVLVREIKTLRGHRETELVRVIEASPDRVAPPCPLYGECGGCDLQHASYPAQLRLKREILREALERTHLELPEGQPEATLASPDALGYRHRIRLHLDEHGQLGFHRIASNQVVPVGCCPLATAGINRVLADLAASDWPRRLADQVAALELIECPASGRVVLVVHPRAPKAPVEESLVTQLASLADGAAMAAGGKDRHRADASEGGLLLGQDFALHGLRYRLQWDHRCFFQVNARQNVHLVELALEFLAPEHEPCSMLELFSGTGNFSIPLALLGAKVRGIEHNRFSLHWAEANCRAAEAKAASFVAADVERQLPKLIHRGQQFDAILLDPPRQGLGKASSLLAELGPRRIVSISCDPATHARDLRTMIESGFRLVRIVPLDCFPQTHHIESAALLERN